MLTLKSFQSAITTLGGDSAAKIRTRLLRAWTEPHRSYHTLQHLEECLGLAKERGSELLAVEQAQLTLALWFHDAIYDTHGHDNERKSAELAQVELAAVGVLPEHCARIAQLVLATEHNAAPQPQDALMALLVDIDLAILGAPADRFAEYEGQVRKEYGWVPDAGYVAGREKVMAHFRSLASATTAALYKTASGRLRLQQARINLGVPA